MGHSGVLLAMYLAIGPAAIDEEQVKTLLLMLEVFVREVRFSRNTCEARRTRRTRRENQSITVAYKPIYAFSVPIASVYKELE